MKTRYEGLLVLNVKGNEESAKEIIERLEGDFKKEGAQVEQVQKIGSRQFSYAAGAVEGGFYVNFIFQGEPSVIKKLQTKFDLNADVYRKTFLKLGPKPTRPAPKPKTPRPAPVAE